MSREIKFRGISTITGSWVYGYLFEDITSARHCCYIIKGGFIPAVSMPSEKFIPVIKEFVGQYTGLKDKQGKEIYEGDIVKVYYDDNIDYCDVLEDESDLIGMIGDVFYSASSYALCLNNGEEHPCIEEIIGDNDTVFVEIIGNVYENPELLKGDV